MTLVEKFKEAVPNSSTGYAGLAPDIDGKPFWVNETVKKEIALKEAIPAVTGNLVTKRAKVLATSFSGTPKKYDVTFATPFVDDNYIVTFGGTNNISCTVENQTNTGFRINTHASTLTGYVGWKAESAGEFSI